MEALNVDRRLRRRDLNLWRHSRQQLMLLLVVSCTCMNVFGHAKSSSSSSSFSFSSRIQSTRLSKCRYCVISSMLAAVAAADVHVKGRRDLSRDLTKLGVEGRGE